MPDLERAEIAAFADAMRAAPDLCRVAEIGGATCLAFPSLDSRLFNRVMGLQSTSALGEIDAFYGSTPYWICDSHELGPELEQRGYVRDYSWMKFSRGVGPREARSDLEVVRVGPEGAADFARVVVEAYGMPDWTSPLCANVVGRPGWSCYVAYEDGAPAGAGALFVDDEVGWLGMAGTLPEFRGRGAQSAILAVRIERARLEGCSVVVTETGELDQQRPSASYRNILRAGFREAGVRRNYRSPENS